MLEIIIYLTLYMNGRATTRGAFKAYVFFYSHSCVLKVVLRKTVKLHLDIRVKSPVIGGNLSPDIIFIVTGGV